MASKSSSAPIGTKLSASAIKRTAVDMSGCVGSLYDKHRDQVLEKLSVNIKKEKPSKHNSSQCRIFKGKKNDNQNLLRLIGIQEELRLSMLLDLVSSTELLPLIDYSYPINEFTCILHYTHTYREEKLEDDAKKAKKQIQSSIPGTETDATHIISGVTWGLHVIIVLKLSPDTQLTDAIDTTLEKIRRTFEKHDSNTLDTHGLNIINTKVYSNIPFLTKATSLDDLYKKIQRLTANNNIEDRPIEYTLRSIQEICPLNGDKHSTNNTSTLSNESPDKNIEQEFFQMSSSIKNLEVYFNENESNVLRQNLPRQLCEMNKGLLDVKKKYSNELDRFSKLVVDFRKGLSDISQIRETLHDKQHTILKTNIDELTATMEDLKEKEQFIIALQTKSFQYWNAAECDFNASIDDAQKVAEKLIKDDQVDRILCSNDKLNKDKSSEFEQLRNKLIKEHQSNPNLRLIYADFSYSSFDLPDTIIFPKVKINHTEDTVINILLLGESGVGKSTFINAFVNYLKFETLKDAELSKPVVLIPVSFMITAGDNFEEKIVNFGEFDESKNEDFDHPGQSVTQRCKSYVFDLKESHGKKLRIIDTPGFGDTRGLDQDDLNMQHILEYINNITRIHAVCFLLKPNVPRLNNYFRTCVTQLLDLLGPNAHENIIFCFTNSRCTFYSPGDTAPPLRALLDSLERKNIQLTKANTFCFDSESFRYLVALKNSIVFNELDRSEYEKSWSKSAIESKLLINYIRDKQISYNIRHQWKSIKHAQIQIIHMIRPILEAMRNTLRNTILLRNNSNNMLIQLISSGVDSPSNMCLSCKPTLSQIANFWVPSNTLHACLKKCLMCHCAPNQHISIDYILQYTISNTPTNDNENKMIDQISLLLNASVELAYILKSTAYFSKDDLFLLGFNQMIQEEKQICALTRDSNQLNVQLLNELKQLKTKYEHRMGEMKSSKNSVDLPVIYERIEITRNYRVVDEQMNAVEKGQENIMKYYEHQISDNHANMSLSNKF